MLFRIAGCFPAAFFTGASRTVLIQGHQIRETQLVVPPVADLELHPISHIFGGSGGWVKRWEQLDREVLLDRESAWWILASRNTEQRILREQLLTILAEA